MARVQIDCATDSVAPVNRDTQIILDLTPCKEEATLKRICAKITGVTDDSEETVEEYNYCAGKETTVLDFRDKVSIEGHVDQTDPAHNYIRGIKYYPNLRRGYAQKIEADGTITEGPCTYTEIKTFGGDMSARLDFSFMITWDDGKNFTVIRPEEGFALPPLPVGEWDLTTPTTSTLAYTFANVTDEDKKALPIAELFAQKYKLMGLNGTDDFINLPYTLAIDTTSTTTTYTLTFDSTDLVDFAGINYGIYSAAGVIYPESTEQYTI